MVARDAAAGHRALGTETPLIVDGTVSALWGLQRFKPQLALEPVRAPADPVERNTSRPESDGGSRPTGRPATTSTFAYPAGESQKVLQDRLAGVTKRPATRSNAQKSKSPQSCLYLDGTPYSDVIALARMEMKQHVADGHVSCTGRIHSRCCCRESSGARLL